MAEESAKPSCPVAVILDANIYFADPALRNPDALVLLHHLEKIGGKLALPEVTRREVEDKIRLVGSRHEKAIAEAVDYFGRLQNSKLKPSHGVLADWIKGFDQRVREIKAVPVPVSDKHLRSAYERVMAKTPPNSLTDQQFKDSLLWEAAIELAETYSVMIVAFDNDFRKGKEDNKLAPNLAEEADKTRCGVEIRRTLPACIEDLKVKSESVDEKEFIPILDISLRSEVNPNTLQLGFTLNDLTLKKLKFYALDAPDLLSVVFDLRYTATDIKNGLEQRREDAIACVEGVCFYHEKEKAVSGIKLSRLLFDWRNADGTPGHGGFVFLSTADPFPLWRGLL
jgi:hypothetical protein